MLSSQRLATVVLLIIAAENIRIIFLHLSILYLQSDSTDSDEEYDDFVGNYLLKEDLWMLSALFAIHSRSLDGYCCVSGIISLSMSFCWFTALSSYMHANKSFLHR